MGAIFSLTRKKTRWNAIFLCDSVEDRIKSRFIFSIWWL